jgi:hypothetical protein
MTDEWSSLLVSGYKIVPIIAFGRKFLVELPPRSAWLSQETSEMLPLDSVIFYTDGSLCEGGAGADVFLAHLAHLLRASNQMYMQLSPILTTVRARIHMNHLQFI